MIHHDVNWWVGFNATLSFPGVRYFRLEQGLSYLLVAMVNLRCRSVVVMFTATLLSVFASDPKSQEVPFELQGILSQVGQQVHRRYQNSQSIVSKEVVWVRSFDNNMRPHGSTRQLEFERREEWSASVEHEVPSVTVLRELNAVNGREPRQGDLEGCLAPRATTADPLSSLLPWRQAEFDFSLGKLEQVEGRQVVRLHYLPAEQGPAEVIWDEDCVSISLPGRSRGEAWVDVQSGEVLRLDERLMQPFDFREPLDRVGRRPGWITLEGVDVSIRYEAVDFEDPDETLMLPSAIEHSWRLRGGGFVPRYVRSHELSDHRRFVTDGRLVETVSADGRSLERE